MVQGPMPPREGPGLNATTDMFTNEKLTYYMAPEDLHHNKDGIGQPRVDNSAARGQQQPPLKKPEGSTTSPDARVSLCI